MRSPRLGSVASRATRAPAGKAWAEVLLADAVRRILGAARSVAVFAIVVDAKDDSAAAFYRRFGFQPFPLQPRRLFLPTSTALAALDRS